MTSSSWFAQDCPDFKTQSPTSWEPLQSWANWDSWSPYRRRTGKITLEASWRCNGGGKMGGGKVALIAFLKKPCVNQGS